MARRMLLRHLVEKIRKIQSLTIFEAVLLVPDAPRLSDRSAL